jgi:outer membrane protein insertion porin family
LYGCFSYGISTLFSQIAMPVGEESAFHLEGHAGLVLPWGGQQTTICDRFFLGGICPDGLRGFKLRGVGPSDARRPGRRERSADEEPPRPDAVGGDLSWSLLAALRFGLPWESLHAAGLRGQLFLNCGNLARLQPARALNDVMSDFFGKFRCSVVS